MRRGMALVAGLAVFFAVGARAVAAPAPLAPLPAAASAAPAAPDLAAHPGAVTSPMVGVAYLLPEPGAAPFVEVGSPVNEDTIVGIIEVMKLMNTVRAGVRGTVTEFRVADGALAEYGEALLRVRKSG